MRTPNRLTRRLLPLALLGTLLVAGCGSDAEGDSGLAAAAPEASEFPAPDGRTIEQMLAETGESDLVVLPAGQVYFEGETRAGFGVFTIEQESVNDAKVAIYAARPDKAARGPFPASIEPLVAAPAFRSKTSSTDPDAAEVVYAADVELPGKGEWRLMAMVEGGDGAGATRIPSAVVGRFPDVPKEGDKAPKISTPTPEDVGGDLTKIDTRQPPSTLHEEDFADVVGEKPVVLLFATPALCTSRVCGPVVDIAEEVKAERPDDAAYILMEIYEDNIVDEGVREQVAAYSLPSEPWLYVIGTDGRISTAIEGAFSKRELETALDEVS